MTQEQLRMQMLAGIITESQYKKEIEELDSMGRIGKSYPAPGTETPTSYEKDKKVENSDLNLFEKWMKDWEPKFKIIKSIMDEYKNRGEDPVKSFIKFGKEVEKKCGWKFWTNLRWANPPKYGFRYNSVWAIDNVAANPSQEGLTPTKNIIYRGGPNNSWIFRSWE